MLYAKVASFHGEIVFLPLPVNAYRSGAPPLPPTPPRPLPGEALSGWVEEVGARNLKYCVLFLMSKVEEWFGKYKLF